MEPKFYTIEQHLIPPEKMDDHAHFIVRKLRENGYSAYIVGGWVRDLLMGASPKDFDICTSAKPEEIKKIFSNCILIGKRFRLAHVRFGKKILEVSTFRTGDRTSSSLITQDNDYGTEEDDACRRDFTINGLFYDLETETIIDYVGGYIDAKKRILRTIGEPKARFCQDPVRMLRLLKFQARFGLSVEKNTRIALEACKNNILKSSQARILEEILRMLESGFAAPFIQHLTKHGFIHLLFPKLDATAISYVLQFLGIADREKERKHLSRSLLLACICYPLFVHHIQNASKKRSLPLHEIAALANETMDAIFSPFFQIPRRMRGSVVYILTTQCRFTPLKETPSRKTRVPYDESLPHAIKFLEMRVKLQPELQERYVQLRQLCVKILAKNRTKSKRRLLKKVSR